MKKIFLTVLSAVVISLSLSNTANATDVQTSVTDESQIVATIDEDGPTGSESDKMNRFYFKLNMGKRNADGVCVGWWPVCEFELHFTFGMDKSGQSFYADYNITDDEVQLILKQKDIEGSKNMEVKRHLIGKKYVTFGQSCNFPEEFLEQYPDLGVSGIDGRASYKISQKNGNITIHIPRVNENDMRR